MTENERIALYKDLWAVNGYEHQMHVAVEEMAELTSALVRKERGRSGEGDIMYEIADVVICMEQLALHFGVAKVIELKEAKLQRLKERLQAKKENIQGDSKTED
jgi:hypothetical protein